MSGRDTDQDLVKEREIKADGRYVLYYSFTGERVRPTTEQAQERTETSQEERADV
ncbi:MAG: hypothetical protein M3P51_09450 [Chloroflexota bacterium]|nr:hypothetical protein [Chloroflexota bacterium]